MSEILQNFSVSLLSYNIKQCKIVNKKPKLEISFLNLFFPAGIKKNEGHIKAFADDQDKGKKLKVDELMKIHYKGIFWVEFSIRRVDANNSSSRWSVVVESSEE